MRGLFGRRKRDEGAATAVAEPPAGYDGTDEQLAAEIRRLTEQERDEDGAGDTGGLIQLRNQAGIRRLRAATGSAVFAGSGSALPDAGGGLPEFTREQVTPELLRSAILRDGCLLVRGLIARGDAEWFAQQIDRTFAERDRHDSGVPYDTRLYQEFTPDPQYGEELARPWIKAGGGVLAVDSPLLNFRMMELFAQARLPQLVGGYLGEAPLITAQKTTLRKAEPSVPGGWHQDGKFMGPVRALNLWLSLSHCGDDAPGLDIVPRRLDDHIVTQTDEALLDYMVSQRVAEQVAGETPILRPIFEPGDALFFDELFLHKTGSDPSMPKPRYAIENWFFGGSGFPVEYAPLAV